MMILKFVVETDVGTVNVKGPMEGSINAGVVGGG